MDESGESGDKGLIYVESDMVLMRLRDPTPVQIERLNKLINKINTSDRAVLMTKLEKLMTKWEGRADIIIDYEDWKDEVRLEYRLLGHNISATDLIGGELHNPINDSCNIQLPFLPPSMFKKIRIVTMPLHYLTDEFIEKTVFPDHVHFKFSVDYIVVDYETGEDGNSETIISYRMDENVEMLAKFTSLKNVSFYNQEKRMDYYSETLDEAVSKLYNLRKLRLRTTFFPSILKATSLRILELDGISEIPEDIGILTDLMILKITGNFSKIPNSILKMKKLRYLELGIPDESQTDATLPDNIGELSALRVLLVYNINIDPEAIEKLRVLFFLVLE